MSRIKIKHFGPIAEGFDENDGFLDIKKATIFIGNQGSGKSTVAKLISTMTWLEKALQRGELTQKEVTGYNRFVNNYCAYQGLKNYFKPETEITYKGNAWAFEFRESKMTVLPGNDARSYNMPKIMYIPAERNFVGAVNRPDKLKGLPGPLLTFLTEYEKAQESLKSNVILPINKVSFEYDKLNKVANIRGSNYKIRLSEASSGFQSSVPLFIVSQFLSGQNTDNSKADYSAEEEKRVRDEVRKIFSNPNLAEDVKIAALESLSSRLFYRAFINIVEEPEQNLFPTSQRGILNKLLEAANRSKGNQLILTTHSPYIINYLTLAIQGFALREKIIPNPNADALFKKLDKITPTYSCISGKDAVVYQLTDEGSIRRLPNYEGIPSDKNYLNQSLAEGNQLFDALLEIEESCQ